MLTTIFTGHSLDLTDIIAVGPIVYPHRHLDAPPIQRSIELTIYCKHGLKIKHVELRQDFSADGNYQSGDGSRNHALAFQSLDRDAPVVRTGNAMPPMPSVDGSWEKARADLKRERDQLLERWGNARDDAADYVPVPGRLTVAGQPHVHPDKRPLNGSDVSGR